MALDQNFDEDKEMSFLDHIDIFRKHLVRSIIAILLLSTVAFIFKEILFDVIIFGPSKTDFWSYRKVCELSQYIYSDNRLCIEKINFTVFNRSVTGQFNMHFFVALVAGFVLAFPYILWEIWRFIRPALSTKERTYATGLVGYGTLLFMSGIGFGYFIMIPISINFLGNYQVSDVVSNDFTLESYINFVSMLTLASAVIFELPIFIYFMAKMGIISSEFLKKYRRYAIVIVLVIAAIVTPPDVASQLILSFPLMLLYEIGIMITKRVEKSRANAE